MDCVLLAQACLQKHFSPLLFCGKPFANRASEIGSPTEAVKYWTMDTSDTAAFIYKLWDNFDIIPDKNENYDVKIYSFSKKLFAWFMAASNFARMLWKFKHSQTQKNISIDWQYQSASNCLKVNANLDLQFHIYIYDIRILCNKILTYILWMFKSFHVYPAEFFMHYHHIRVSCDQNQWSITLICQ